MKLEPAVIERIERERKSLLYQKVVAVVPPIVGILILLGLNIELLASAKIAVLHLGGMSMWASLLVVCALPTAIFGYYSNQRLEMPALALALYAVSAGTVATAMILGFTAASSKSTALTSVLPASLILLLILLPPVLISLTVIKRARDQLISLLNDQMLDSNTDTAAIRFRNGLDGVSIALDIHNPVLARLSIPSSSTLAVLDRHVKPVVLITKAALEAPLSDQESEGLMAHELSHLVIGECAKRPGVRDLGTFSPLFCVALVQLAVASLIISTDMRSGILFLILAISFVLLGTLIGGFLYRKYNLLEEHNDLLADSIAVKATSNAKALRSAISKLSEAGLISRINLKLMPRKEPNQELYIRYLSPIVLSAHNLDERLRNLDEIARGHWQEFEQVVEGQPLLESSEWE